MAVDLDFFSLVIRRDRLQAILPGGWPQFLAEYGGPPASWVDDELVRFGAKTAPEIEALIAHWTWRGLVVAQGAGSGPDRSDMVVLHAAPAGAQVIGCVWLAVTDESRACFVGTRQPVLRPRFNSPWSDDLARLSQELILKLLATPPDLRAPLPLKNWDGSFALLQVDPRASAGLVATDRETGARRRYALIEDLLDAGWAVD